MNNKSKQDASRIYWACRRGMLELDIMIIPFFKEKYASLDEVTKANFVRLLASDDPDIYSWIMGHQEPTDPELKNVIQHIQEHNQERGPMAI